MKAIITVMVCILVAYTGYCLICSSSGTGVLLLGIQHNIKRKSCTILGCNIPLCQIEHKMKPITNPFLTNNEFHLKAVQIYQRSYQGAGHFMEETTRKYIVEEQAKVSMYKIGNNEQMTTFMFQVLSQQGRNLFLYILSTIGENKDSINLNTEKLTKIMGVSRNTLSSGRDDLRDNGIITLYKKDEYWVNPFFIFRGDRISYYQEHCPECIKVVSKVTTGQLLSDNT